MDKKESMEIMRTWPRMTKEDVQRADALFTHYLFFNAAGEVTASCCGKSGVVKSQALGRHREPGVCPFCGSKAIWYGKRFGKKGLKQFVPVMFIHKRNGTVYLRTCWMKRGYGGCSARCAGSCARAAEKRYVRGFSGVQRVDAHGRAENCDRD